jgi:hypothetical protein
MKWIPAPIAIVLTVLLSVPGGPAYSQQATADGNGNSNQWTSHQMNQPPPAPRNRYKISPDRMDEIRELYISAKKELKKKGKKTAQ